MSVLRQFPTLAQTDPALPTFAVTFQKERSVLTYHIPFEMRLATLTLQSEAVLNQVLVQMGSVGEARIEIHGYTDSFGSEESNMALSRRRGEMVYSWLQEKLGAAFPKHVQVIPHGKNDLLVNDQVQGEYVPELMAQNRRVVLKIFPL
jgi:outer membrane protein OmpA-like peptidoglycan-associated protein